MTESARRVSFGALLVVALTVLASHAASARTQAAPVESASAEGATFNNTPAPLCSTCQDQCRPSRGYARATCLRVCFGRCVNEQACGNGRVQLGEHCDDGNDLDNDGCSALCEIEVCGDGIVQSPREQCDDGNDVDGDACSNQCVSAPTCGNGQIDSGEVCDDGNLVSGDGCSAVCRLEGACGAYEPPSVTSDVCAPAIEIASTAEFLILLPAFWSVDYGQGEVFPVSPNVRVTADFTVTAADLPNSADIYWGCSNPWICTNVRVSLDSHIPTGPTTVYQDASGTHFKAGTTFRISTQVYIGYPPFYPILDILRSCDQPCATDEVRCPGTQVCLRSFQYCLRCLALEAACCACTDPTGALDNGTTCGWLLSDILFFGTCSQGYCLRSF